MSETVINGTRQTKACLCRDICCSGHFSKVCQYMTKVLTNFSPIPISVPRLLKYSDLLFLSNLFYFHLLIYQRPRQYFFFLTDRLYFDKNFSVVSERDDATRTGLFLISNFRRILKVVFFLLGPGFSTPPVKMEQGVPKRWHIKIRRLGNHPKEGIQWTGSFSVPCRSCHIRQSVPFVSRFFINLNLFFCDAVALPITFLEPLLCCISSNNRDCETNMCLCVCIHSVFCLTTGPKPPPKRCLHIVRSRASSFK